MSDMNPDERRRLREEALECALKVKNPEDTYEDVITAAKAYGDWVVNGAPEADGPKCSAASVQSDPNVDSGLSYADASLRAKDLLVRGAATGNWFDLPERLIRLREQMRVQAFKGNP